ncbi:uncharacterized protein A1O9_06453 [Exophiala aquamarina CBS 119918]|uniref:Copper acquisition factor BIM1-like domain-containing protein n=1 Tax=Exophiala aquamarina CBS 119918 TaxID=1182545 RepID=A0A072PFH7_9EURO|nr:uncharacterized protein A1O9_06453 [Exophiala aquamarina CBS 119918]KEF58527.1 hypothetical protein A1O9_06453 [Exophiala aquamarina CBS 119918]
MIPPSLLALLALPLFASAHFELSFPAPRGNDDENQATFPCGGYDQTQNRTRVSMTSVAVAVELGHTENLFQIALAIGNDVGDSFNTIILPTIEEFGPGEFCLAAIPIPADLNITEGTNGTIQVITNSHDGSGLYNCADITFTSTSPEEPSSCTNGTGISASPLVGSAYVNANESSSHEGDHASSSAAPSGTAASATGSSTPTPTGNYASMLSVGWGLLGAAVLGGVAML